MPSRVVLAGFVAGGLIGGLLHGFGRGLLSMDLVLAAGLLLLMFLRRRRAAIAAPPWTPTGVPSDGERQSSGAAAEHPGGDSNLDRGVQDIRQTDPGFDPSRFVGYAAMMFRDTQSAWLSRDVGPLRDRVTSEMYGRLQVHCDGLQSSVPTHRVEPIEIGAEITEAWQAGHRDYVTAHITGSHGPRPVDEFWTFTRPAGLNFWMLSAIQPLATSTGQESLP
jgi:predicted lipid-binding transport protein (Tim44 family)